MNLILNKYFNLQNGAEDKQKTLENVKSNVSFTGSNLWILICAIIVASVGLNVNSTAVIIGAMLISPLMGPIVGAGFALGVYDFPLLKRALRNLLIATFVGLIVSFLYFLLSPFKAVQSEMLARTAPNIYDILIAFFGGLVGVIAVTRVEKGNPIPGVAIATALMPPLCTAGYGLAIGNISYFLGAMFLYSINCVFICIATFSIVKYLKFPLVEETNLLQMKRVKYGITVLIFVLLIPSVLFAYSLFKQQKFNQLIEIFLEEEFAHKGNVIIFKHLDYASNPKKVEVAFLSEQFSASDIIGYNQKLSRISKNTKLIFKQYEGIKNLKGDILNEIFRAQLLKDSKKNENSKLEQVLTSYQINTSNLLIETQVFLPHLTSIGLMRYDIYEKDSISSFKYVLLFKANQTFKKNERQKLKEITMLKYQLKDILIIQE